MTINNSLSRFFIFGVNCLLIGALTLSACSNRQRQASSNGDGVSATAPDPSTSSQPIGGETRTIDNIFFNSLVDNVSCHYLYAYANKYINDKVLVREFTKYLSKDELNNLIGRIDATNSNNSNNVRSNMVILWTFIEKKRNNYTDTTTFNDNDKLIEYLIEVPSKCGFENDLAPANNSLKTKLESYLDNSNSIEIENNEREPAEQESEGDSATNHGKCKLCGKDVTKPGQEFCKNSCERKYNRKHERDKKEEASDTNEKESDTKKTKRWYFLFGLLTGAVGMGVVLGKRYKSENSQLSKQSNFNEELLKAKENKINELQKQINQIRKEKDDLLEDNIALGKEMDELKAKGGNNRTVSETIKTDSHSQTPRQSVPSVLFADSIVEECLIRVQEVEGEDSVFELHLKTPDTAEFVICARANQRIVANPSFIEGCDKQVLPNATNIEIVAPGAAQKDPSNGKWIVTKKLKVNIR